MSDELRCRYRKGWRSLGAGPQIPIGSHLCTIAGHRDRIIRGGGSPVTLQSANNCVPAMSRNLSPPIQRCVPICAYREIVEELQGAGQPVSSKSCNFFIASALFSFEATTSSTRA